MNDLISRQSAIDLIENESRKYGDEYGVSNVLCDLADMPSAQPERCEDCVNFSKTRLLIPQPEIIRCKDCKFSIPINDDEDGYRCTFHEQYYDNEKRMLWHSGCFCSFGERRRE